ncbi:MAG: tetratricopeptide repeat protein [Sphingomonadaceae bacterium]|nr:tetratricopeptide repeat protein [Sphingomonadaceae bacterium]
MIRRAIVFVLFASVPAIAQSAVTVLGNNLARLCYEAAVQERPSASNIRTCDSALQDGPLFGHDRVATHVNRGILHAQSGDFEAALADYDRALQLDDEEADAYLNKGLALLRRDGTGEVNALMPLVNAAIEYGTSEPAVAYYVRAIVHEENGDVPAAYYDLRRAQELDPDWEVPTRELERFVVQQ